MRAIWNGHVAFGLVMIPVALGVAQRRNDVSFRTLSRETLRPVKQKRWDVDRDVEVGPDETVRGWEHAKGAFVAIEDHELERFAAPREKAIDILRFVDTAEVDPVFFDKAYWLQPQERADRPYALLLRALERSGKAALGKMVLSTKEHPVLIRPYAGVLALETLHYTEDLRLGDAADLASALEATEVSDAELQMAEQLIGAGAGAFAPGELVNATRAALLEFLAQKAAGVDAPDIVVPEAAPAPVDLMEALKASIAAGAPTPAGAGD